MSLKTSVNVWMAALLFTASCAANAQGFPSRPIRVIDAFSPGGTSDYLARIVAARLSEVVGQAVVVENRPGGGGTVGASAVAKAAPDGHTVLLGVNTVLAASPNLNAKLPYDVLKDLTPITGIATGAYVVIAPSSSDARSISDLVAMARARPGQLNYASAGIGSGTHLICELFKRRAGIDVVHVAHRAGTALVSTVIAGDVNFACITTTAALGQIRGGKLKALAVTSVNRLAVLPDVPTISESGFSDFEAAASFGLYAPGGTPRDIVTVLNKEIRKVLEMTDVRERFAALAVVANGSSPEDLGASLAAETRRWAEVIKAAGIRAE
jgi:tripartite-type tricarboxylate transporter receptor subunit TctC